MGSATMPDNPVTVAVVTGGHPYDVLNFHRLFRSFEGLDIYIQHMDDFVVTSHDVRDGYDVVLFYDMLMEGPSDEGQPWYGGKPETVFKHLGEAEQGIVLLHHAILAYPQSPLWDEIVGIQDRSFGYYPDQTVRIEIVDPQHPITKGMTAWEMVDETYTMNDAAKGNKILLTADHPKSMNTIAWTRSHKRARVFCFASGHDNQTWPDPNFREILLRGILWAANRNPD